MSQPLVGLIGGTGLGEALTGELTGKSVEADTPFGPPSGPILMGRIDDQPIALLARHGPGHVLPPTAVPSRANIYAMKALGVTHIIASGATGSLREDIHPRDLVVCDQVIDKTHARPSTFFDDFVGHVEFADPFCNTLRRMLIETAANINVNVHPKGTYVCMEGPQFSTRAESAMHRLWGGDLIGMTCMPEAKLAREAEICYALVAMATDYDCWRPHDGAVDQETLIAEIVGHLKAATANAVRLIRAAVPRVAAAAAAPCPCQSALAMAIWSDRKRISPAAIAKLGPIVAKYFDV